MREDENGILTDWLWYEVVGTDLCGSGMVTTSDDGVFFERITYFKRGTRQRVVEAPLNSGREVTKPDLRIGCCAAARSSGSASAGQAAMKRVHKATAPGRAPLEDGPHWLVCGGV